MATENVPAAADDLPEENLPNTRAQTNSNVHPVIAGFNGLPIVRQAALIAGVAFIIGVIAVAMMWNSEPTYKPLIHRLQDYNAQDIVEVLQREGIDFQVDPSAKILMVKANDVHKARMKLAAVSLLDDKSVGLEVLERDSSLGTSQFIENARYRRGLEGELARTIASVRSVRNARVHLAIPKQSVFVL